MKLFKKVLTRTTDAIIRGVAFFLFVMLALWALDSDPCYDYGNSTAVKTCLEAK